MTTEIDRGPSTMQPLVEAIHNEVFQTMKKEIDARGINGTIFARAITNKFGVEFEPGARKASILEMDGWLFETRQKVFDKDLTTLKELLRWVNEEVQACSDAEMGIGRYRGRLNQVGQYICTGPLFLDEFWRWGLLRCTCLHVK